jgi:hypothetical protein
VFGDVSSEAVPFLVVDNADTVLEDSIPISWAKDKYVWPVPGYLKLTRMEGKSGRQSVFLKSANFRCERWSNFAVAWRNRQKIDGLLTIADPAHFCPKAEEEGTVVIIGAEYTPTHFAGRDVELITEKWRITITEKDVRVDGKDRLPVDWLTFTREMTKNRQVFWVAPGN